MGKEERNNISVWTKQNPIEGTSHRERPGRN